MRFEGIPSPGQQVIPDTHNLLKIGVLILLLCVAFAAGHYGALALQQGGAVAEWWLPIAKWLWLLLWGVAASAAVQGLGVLAHDAVHKVMLSRLWLNELVGALISAVALLPFHANRQFHLAHHRYSHQRELDPEHPMHHHPLWFAISVGSLIGLGLQYRILLQNLVHRRYLGAAARDIAALGVAAGGYMLLLTSTEMAFEHTLLPMLLVLPLVFGVRAISDHYGLPAIARQPGEAVSVQQEVSGWVILTAPLLEWLWSSVNYHEVHHKFPHLSHRYLKRVFASTRGQLPYVVARGYLRNLWRHRSRTYYHAALPESDLA